jgi:hypothetical protein
MRNFATQKVWTADDRIGSGAEELTVSKSCRRYPDERTQSGPSLMSLAGQAPTSRLPSKGIRKGRSFLESFRRERCAKGRRT